MTKPVKYLDPEQCEELRPSLRRFVMAQNSGVPIRVGYSERTERQLRNELVRAGIFFGHRPGLIVKQVSELLSPDRMKVSYPKSLKECGLVAVV